MYRLEIIDFDKDIAGEETGVMFDFNDIGDIVGILNVLILKENDQCIYKVWKLKED